MRSLRKPIHSILLCALVLALLLPARTFAAGLIDPDKDTKLTVTFTPEDAPAPGVEFRLYKVADVAANGEYTVVDAFAGYPVSWDCEDIDDWNELVNTLMGYVAADAVKPDATAVTDAAGAAVFADIPVGIYLVDGDPFEMKKGVKFAVPAAFIVDMPKRQIAEDLSGDSWQYEVVSDCKYEVSYSDKMLKVTKMWDDDGSSQRPKEVTIELYENNVLSQTVILSKDNNWSHTWENLYGGSVWTVREREVPKDYEVQVKITTTDNISYDCVVINTLPEEEEDDEDDDEPTPTPTPPPTPTPAPNAPPKLPQTGVLWWPVPVLLFAGAIMILFGLFRRKENNDEE